MSLIAVSIEIRGKVQGVWFRASTQKIGESLNLIGFVENRPDGSVYLEACGNKSDIHQLIVWCLEGSELAVVDEVYIIKRDTFHLESFSIKK